jgi:uncharacterized protein
MTNSSSTSTEPSSAPARVSSPAAQLLLAGVRLYQRLFAGRLSPCRFYPSCSSYAVEAIEVHGAGRGSWLAVRRLLKCRPLGPKGVDLVPLRDAVRS